MMMLLRKGSWLGFLNLGKPSLKLRVFWRGFRLQNQKKPEFIWQWCPLSSTEVVDCPTEHSNIKDANVKKTAGRWPLVITAVITRECIKQAGWSACQQSACHHCCYHRRVCLAVKQAAGRTGSSFLGQVITRYHQVSLGYHQRFCVDVLTGYWTDSTAVFWVRFQLQVIVIIISSAVDKDFAEYQIVVLDFQHVGFKV